MVTEGTHLNLVKYFDDAAQSSSLVGSATRVPEYTSNTTLALPPVLVTSLGGWLDSQTLREKINDYADKTQRKQPQIADPVEMSVTRASPRPSFLPRANPRKSVELTTYRSVSKPARPMPRILAKVTLAP